MQDFIKQGCKIIIFGSLITGCSSSGTYDISGQSPSAAIATSETLVLESVASPIAEPVEIQKRRIHRSKQEIRICHCPPVEEDRETQADCQYKIHIFISWRVLQQKACCVVRKEQQNN